MDRDSKYEIAEISTVYWSLYRNLTILNSKSYLPNIIPNLQTNYHRFQRVQLGQK